MSAQTQYSDEIDLRKVLLGLLSRKKWIIRGITASTILSIIIVLIIPQSFESTGYFKFTSVSIPTYKNYTGGFEDVSLLRSYVDAYHEDTTWKFNSDIFEYAFEPVYGFGKNPKNLMKENTVLGIQITCTANTAEEAQRRVESLGGYLQTSLVNMEIWKHYAGMEGRLDITVIKSKSGKVEKKLDLEILNKKIELINNNMSKYISATETYDRQVVKLDETTEKYLPLPQQLIAAMISLNNLDIEMNQIIRRQNIAEILLGFIHKVDGLIKDKSVFLVDRDLLTKMIKEKNTYFNGLKEDRDVLTARYKTESQLQGYSLLALEQYQYVSGPILPKSPIKPMRLLIVISVFFASLILLVTYGILVSWWKREG